MNWNIKNRWEQRELDDVLKNLDVRATQFRDFTNIRRTSAVVASNIQEFDSVDQIYYFMENMFTEGFDEHHISIALDVFIRDIA